MTDRENFPNAPLRLVSFDLQFPIRRRLATRAVWDAFEEAFADDLQLVEAFAKEADETDIPKTAEQPVIRRTTLNRDTAVTVRYGSLTVETTEYDSFSTFRKRIDAAVNALAAVSATSVVRRVGLRFINEIRVPERGETIRDWEPYINPSLLRFVEDHPTDLDTSWFHGELGFHAQRGNGHTYLAYGPLLRSALETDGVLQLPKVDGPCFLLDIDTFVSARATKIGDLTTQELLGIVDELHEFAESVFSWGITEKLRDDVLRIAHEHKSELTEFQEAILASAKEGDEIVRY